MSEIAKNVKTEVNTYTREEVQALVNNLHAENIKSNVKKEETHKAHEKSTDTPTLAIEKENEKGAELENPENETASAEKEEIQTTQVAKQFHETDLPEKTTRNET
ncbi:MAG: hypothetical protein HWD61_01300 [Parachlamydiaceae bacterium]|nr:MAG: hypothetical protein HWD61_01300 [Parachlamydiaceae bacterium]